LLRSEVFEDLVLDFQNIHAKLFLKWSFKLLTQVIE
jgi:hypothetical protein